jgi:glutamate-ammonia-ligase adenylyltransferase
MRESNRQQSALASASIDAATVIARREIVRRYGELRTEPRLAVLGLGRLGGGGLDFGSDLDVVLVYDDTRESPLPGMDLRESYARFTELFVAALSSMTRDGYLYRVDLRLRPDGKNGPSSIGAATFLEYLKNRSAPWEWLAYVKLRAAGVDIAFGAGIEAEARGIVHVAARKADAVSLREETRKVRERLQMEKTLPRTNAIDIKYGVGGMLDVYFATRYLQLRDDVPDQAGDRSTSHTLDRLLSTGSLSKEEHNDMKSGYSMLRRLDHLQRLTLGRSTRLPDVEHPAFGDLARQMDSEPRILFESVKERMKAIRSAYERILS